LDDTWYFSVVHPSNPEASYSQWDLPSHCLTDIQRYARSVGWDLIMAPSGSPKSHYFCRAGGGGTCETTWDVPPAVIKAIRGSNHPDPATEPAASSVLESQRASSTATKDLLLLLRDRHADPSASYTEIDAFLSAEPAWGGAPGGVRRQALSLFSQAQARQRHVATALAVRRQRQALTALLAAAIDAGLLPDNATYDQASALFQADAPWVSVPLSERRDVFADAIEMLAAQRYGARQQAKAAAYAQLSSLIDPSIAAGARSVTEMMNSLSPEDVAALGLTPAEIHDEIAGRLRAVLAEEREALACQAEDAKAALQQVYDTLAEEGKLHVKCTFADILPFVLGLDCYRTCTLVAPALPESLFADVHSRLSRTLRTSRPALTAAETAAGAPIAVTPASTFAEFRAAALDILPAESSLAASDLELMQLFHQRKAAAARAALMSTELSRLPPPDAPPAKRSNA
jgi:hypothetical protein